MHTHSQVEPTPYARSCLQHHQVLMLLILQLCMLGLLTRPLLRQISATTYTRLLKAFLRWTWTVPIEDSHKLYKSLVFQALKLFLFRFSRIQSMPSIIPLLLLKEQSLLVFATLQELQQLLQALIVQLVEAHFFKEYIVMSMIGPCRITHKSLN